MPLALTLHSTFGVQIPLGFNFSKHTQPWSEIPNISAWLSQWKVFSSWTMTLLSCFWPRAESYNYHGKVFVAPFSFSSVWCWADAAAGQKPKLKNNNKWGSEKWLTKISTWKWERKDCSLLIPESSAACPEPLERLLNACFFWEMFACW